MLPINNSDTAWLVVTDYNQDNNLPYEDLREDVLNPDVNQWQVDWRYGNQKVGDYIHNVGSNIGTVAGLDIDQGVVGFWDDYQNMSCQVGGICCVGSMGTQVGGNYDSN